MIMILINFDNDVLEKGQHIIYSVFFADTFWSKLLNQLKELFSGLELKVN